MVVIASWGQVDCDGEVDGEAVDDFLEAACWVCVGRHVRHGRLWSSVRLVLAMDAWLVAKDVGRVELLIGLSDAVGKEKVDVRCKLFCDCEVRQSTFSCLLYWGK